MQLKAQKLEAGMKLGYIQSGREHANAGFIFSARYNFSKYSIEGFYNRYFFFSEIHEKGFGINGFRYINRGNKSSFGLGLQAASMKGYFSYKLISLNYPANPYLSRRNMYNLMLGYNYTYKLSKRISFNQQAFIGLAILRNETYIDSTYSSTSINVFKPCFNINAGLTITIIK
jgi:hypothetical protein